MEEERKWGAGGKAQENFWNHAFSMLRNPNCEWKGYSRKGTLVDSQCPSFGLRMLRQFKLCREHRGENAHAFT